VSTVHGCWSPYTLCWMASTSSYRGMASSYCLTSVYRQAPTAHSRTQDGRVHTGWVVLNSFLETRNSLVPLR
jgi:hypothetical protein